MSSSKPPPLDYDATGHEPESEFDEPQQRRSIREMLSNWSVFLIGIGVILVVFVIPCLWSLSANQK
jgi:hypothetical protein